MDFADLFHRITLSIMQAGMPAVHAYHLISGNIFLNVEAEEATGLEKIANVTLTPVHYLLAGNVAVLDPETHTYQLVQKHDYREFFMLKTAASIAALPFSLIVGSVLKGAAFCFSETRHRHKAILASIASTDIRSNLDYYRFIGLHLPEVEEIEAIAPPSYFRRPGDEKVLSKEKEALKEVAQILREKKIPFWIDCGTCLGAYRYGGVIPWDFDIDMAVLEKDFDNVKHALNALDRKKYIVQDWSGRTRPKTYLKVYVRETGVLIDIYHFSIDEEKKTLAYILSNEDSIFLPESWKTRERRYTTPVSYETVFPLKKAIFDGIEVLVPGETKKYLQSRYGENIDPNKLYNENTGRYERDLSHPYWQLAHQK